MKTHPFILFGITALILPLRAADPPPFPDQIFPKLQIRQAVALIEAYAQKEVVVANPEKLNRTTSFVLKNCRDREMARKVLEAILVLEGFEIVEKDGKLEVVQFLTDEQRTTLNESLGRDISSSDDEPLPRPRIVIPRREQPTTGDHE